MLLLLVHYATSYSPKVIPSYALSCCLTAYQGSSPVARDADIILLTDRQQDTPRVYYGNGKVLILL